MLSYQSGFRTAILLIEVILVYPAGPYFNNPILMFICRVFAILLEIIFLVFVGPVALGMLGH
jgi:hypothetical protein